MDILNILEESFKTLIENPLLLIALIIGIIVIIRDIRCWYWKIEERLELQKQELATLTELVDLQKKQIRLLESNISKMNQLIYNTSNTEENKPISEEKPK